MNPSPTHTISRFRDRFILQSILMITATMALLFAQQTARADQLSIAANYQLNLSGIRFAKVDMNTVVDNGTYVITVNARNSGFGKLFRFAGTTQSSGQFSNRQTVPLRYSVDYHVSKKQQKISMSFVDRKATNLSILRPLDAKEQRIPVTEDLLQNVFDPVSAFVFPMPQALNGVSACNRTTSVYDGRYRFDLTMNFMRVESRPSLEHPGQATSIFVCSMKYTPIAGHKGNHAYKFHDWANRDGVEVWLMPLQGADVLLPYRGVFPTPVGRAIFNLKDFSMTGSFRQASAN